MESCTNNEINMQFSHGHKNGEWTIGIYERCDLTFEWKYLSLEANVIFLSSLWDCNSAPIYEGL